MYKEYSYSRKVILDTHDTFRPVAYEHGIKVGYTHEEIEENTIIDSQEFKELAETVNSAQRKQILEDMGLDELPIDKIRKITAVKRKRLLRKAE